MKHIRNFGRNIDFESRRFYTPNTETELLEILQQHSQGQIRVMGSKHSWSPVIISHDALIDMQRLCQVEIIERDGQTFAKVGAGCQVKDLLPVLNQYGLTIPSVGLITEQTIAGATATGTHGSGKHSLSHYVAAVRIACYRDGEPGIVELRDTDAIRAARCSLGCLGVVASVEIPCVPQYNVLEFALTCATAEQALAGEADTPLQQFFLMPHSWSYLVQRRQTSSDPISRTAWIYRMYWWLGLDIGFHLAMKTSAAWLRSRRLVHALFKYIVPLVVIKWWQVVDRSDRMLVMKHELFRHLELEAFVQRSQVGAAARFVIQVLKQADGVDIQMDDETRDRLSEAGLWHDFQALRGKFTHHYPICFRRIEPDDTLVSMASGGAEDWYSISFITYVQPREPFYQLATFLAQSMLALFSARIHWGKWFPLDATHVEQMYPELEKFRTICREHDPNGVFQNDFTSNIVFGQAPKK